MKKTLLAFLGTTDYLPCNYAFEDKLVYKEIRFVQEAIASMLMIEKDVELDVKLFVTKDALEKNYFDNENKDNQGNILQKEGLKRRLEQLNGKIKISKYDIPEGISEEQIWKIFQIIFQNLPEESEIYFDITHAFRSLPMLAIIVLAYGKVLKKIKVKGLYYGAFEILGTVYEARKKSMDQKNVPILDLTSFLTLFDWLDYFF